MTSEAAVIPMHEESERAMRFMTRDAAWLNRPNTRHPKKYHAATSDDTAACSGMLLDEKTELPYERVPQRLQCNRRGCIQVFIEAEMGAAGVPVAKGEQQK